MLQRQVILPQRRIGLVRHLVEITIGQGRGRQVLAFEGLLQPGARLLGSPLLQGDLGGDTPQTGQFLRSAPGGVTEPALDVRLGVGQPAGFHLRRSQVALDIGL